VIKDSLKILVIDDSEFDFELLTAYLQSEIPKIKTRVVDTAEAMIALLNEESFDIIISDYKMPQFSALAALEIAKKHAPDVPFIVVSGAISEEVAIQVLKAGASDFFLKGKYSRLLPAIDRELREAENRKRLIESEEQFRHSQKMEAIGLLAAGVVHDFNNILGMIFMCSEIMKRYITEKDKGFSELEQIRKAAESAAILNKQLLAFCRKQKIDPVTFVFDDAIRNVEKMLVRVIDKNCEVLTELGCGDSKINFDSCQLDQILVNLVINARDAIDAGGTIRIRTEVVEVSNSNPRTGLVTGKYLSLIVSDTGHGMDEGVKSRIFEPFFTTKAPGNGTGLGLSTVYGIVKQSHGHIQVQSSPNEGATFTIYLPAA
jgi:signal transduction histidine kinase